jgi:beta-lactamase regulating signal transducer with metallopeptidase domain
MIHLPGIGLSLAEPCRGLLEMGVALLLQSTLLLLMGFLAGGLLRRQGPAVQSLIYRATLVGVVGGALLAGALAPFVLPLWRISLPPPWGEASVSRPAEAAGPDSGARRRADAAETARAPSGLLKAPADRLAPRISREARRTGVRPAVSTPGSDFFGMPSDRPGEPAREIPVTNRLGWLYIAATGLWGLGTLLLLGWLTLCHLCVLRLGKQSVGVGERDAAATLQSLCEAMRLHPPLLLASPRVRNPFLARLPRPAIFLPSGYEQEFGGPALRAILAHELAHLARRDCEWNLAARVAGALGWVQPLLWALCCRLELASEEVCDQMVLRHEGDPREYADCLLRLAERLFSLGPERVIGAGVAPFRSSLGRRIQQILDRSHRPALSLSPRARTAIALGTAPAVFLSVFLASVPGPPRRPGASGTDTAQTDKAHPFLTVAQARGQLSFPLFVPRYLPPEASLLGVVVSRTEVVNLGAIFHYVHSHRWIASGFGVMIWPYDGKYRIAGMPGSPAQRAGIGTQALTLLRLNGHAVRMGRELLALLQAPRPVQVTFQGLDGKVHTVSLRKTEFITGPPVPQFDQRKGAGLDLTFRGRSMEVIERPTPRDARAPRYARHVRVGGRDVAIYGTHEVHSAFWREAGVDLEVNNRAGMSEEQVLRLIGSMRAEPSLAGRTPQQPSSALESSKDATITGRVVDEGGRPAPGIRVMAQAQHGIRGARLWAEDISHADGSYRLTGLQTAPYNVAVEDPSLQWVAAADQGVAATEGQTTTAPDLVLTHGAFVQGTVVDRKSGAPLRGVNVTSIGPFRPFSSAMVLMVMTDPQGRFKLRVAPGENHVCVDDDFPGDYVSTRDKLYPAGEPSGVPVTLNEGDTKAVTLRIDPEVLAISRLVRPTKRRP